MNKTKIIEQTSTLKILNDIFCVSKKLVILQDLP